MKKGPEGTHGLRGGESPPKLKVDPQKVPKIRFGDVDTATLAGIEQKDEGCEMTYNQLPVSWVSRSQYPEAHQFYQVKLKK